jgi:hypothetical protein
LAKLFSDLVHAVHTYLLSRAYRSDEALGLIS